MKLNKLQEAEHAMQAGQDGQIPNGAFGYHLLGEICRFSETRILCLTFSIQEGG